jgi:replicative DNA helicase
MTPFEKRIKQGLDGEYEGLANGFNRLNNYIYNTQRSCYTLIGGLSGSSKTTLCDFIILRISMEIIQETTRSLN